MTDTTPPPCAGVNVGQCMAENSMCRAPACTRPVPGEGRDTQRADHYQHLYEQASEGKCGYSGLTIGACKASICDCFQFPWVQPAPEEHPDPAPPVADDGRCTCTTVCESETDDGCRYCRTADPELPCPNLDGPVADDGLRERVEALRTEMVGLQAAGAPLVARSWVIHKIDAALDATTEEGQ